jgi:plastocyanin
LARNDGSAGRGIRGGLTVRMLGALVLALAAGSVRAETVRIKIDNLAFVPAQVTAHVGDTIEWMNADFLAHTATARDGAFDVMIPANGKARTVAKAAGAVDYYCKFHPNMAGKVVVGK